MVSLVYVSSTARPFTESELVDLLEGARENNARLNITGLLLYEDGNVMQALEGEADDVRALFARIDSDPRHRNVLVILYEEITERAFPDWSMAFRNLRDPAIRELPGFSDVLQEPFRAELWRGDPSRARRLLNVFRDGLRLGLA